MDRSALPTAWSATGLEGNCHPSLAVRGLAHHLVVMAKADALQMLGEHEAGARLAMKELDATARLSQAPQTEER